MKNSGLLVLFKLNKTSKIKRLKIIDITLLTKILSKSFLGLLIEFNGAKMQHVIKLNIKIDFEIISENLINGKTIIDNIKKTSENIKHLKKLFK